MIELDPAEEWRAVADFPSYQVSNRGRVKRVARTSITKSGQRRHWPEMVLKQKSCDGYPAVALTRDGECKTRRVHRLMLTAFVGPCPPGHEGCHNNGDRADLRLSNLRWDTSLANSADTRRHGTHHRQAQKECKRGHRLEGPNLRPDGVARGYRPCLSCNRAFDHLRYAFRVKASEAPDLMQTVSDRYYAEIMGGIGSAA